MRSFVASVMTGIRQAMVACALCACLHSSIAAVEDQGKDAAKEARRSAKADDVAKAARQKIMREVLLDHFCIGIEAPPEWHDDVRKTNGARLDFNVCYLSGGAAKDTPWWIKYSDFVGVSIQRCKARGQGMWFTFYMLAESNPADYKPGPAQATPTNAKVAGTMKSYFELFKHFCETCAAYPDVPVVAQIEPDEWCHLLLSAKMDPAAVDIKVGTCGMEELKGLPDNLFGYAAALKLLRDRYAPMVLLGCNPSGWDYGGSMSGTKMGALMKAVCPGYDLAVFETGDRDKGMSGQQPPFGDKSGVCGTFPNHIQWIKEFHEQSGLWVCVWQAAVGNTYFATCDNKPGHYCDNLAQFLFEDYPRNDGIAKYVAAGCCGWMFNAGQSDCTHVFDERKDGITNPPAGSWNKGKKSIYADDDGGFMRLMCGEYYKHPYPILGKARRPKVGGDGDVPGAEAGSGGTKSDAEKTKTKAILSDKDALKTYTAKLRDRVQEELATGRHPAFVYSALRSKAVIEAIDQETLRVALADGGAMDLPWSMLKQPDLLQLSLAVERDSKPEDHAIAGFFLLADGQIDKADEHLRQAIGCDELVRRAFTAQ